MPENGSRRKPFTRALCRTERVYLIYHELCPPFANQLVLEGHGEPDILRWVMAVRRASEANPGSRLVLRGHWALSRWVDSGITPRVRTVDGSSWDGYSAEGAPFEQGPLPCREGPTCEVVLIEGDPLRVVFRSHHAVMDGRGTVLWAEDIFRALRGENPVGSDATVTELELARSFQKKGRVPPLHIYHGPAGRAQGDEPGVVWHRLSLPGRYPNLVAQCAVLLGQLVFEQGEEQVLFGVSVDMRPRQPGLRSTGNLTNLLYLKLEKGMGIEDVARDLARQLDERRDGMLYWGDRLVPFAPLSMIRRAVRKEISTNRQKGSYRTSGLLSNPGRLSRDKLSCDIFRMDTGFFIPPRQESMPIFIASSGTSRGVELVFSLSRVLASNGRLEAIMAHVRNGLKPS